MCFFPRNERLLWAILPNGHLQMAFSHNYIESRGPKCGFFSGLYLSPQFLDSYRLLVSPREAMYGVRVYEAVKRWQGILQLRIFSCAGLSFAPEKACSGCSVESG